MHIIWHINNKEAYLVNWTHTSYMNLKAEGPKIFKQVTQVYHNSASD